MARYPVIAEPLSPGLVTLSQWAASVGRAPGTIRSRWARRPDFPAPVGRTPGRGRHGGGLGELVYRSVDLDAFQPKPQPSPLDDVRIGPGQRVTLGWFADHAAKVARKTVTQYRGTPGFPAPGTDGRYRYGDLAAWWRSRPGRGARRANRGEPA
jgi:hypothetical protein